MNWAWVEENLCPESHRPTPLPLDFAELIVNANPEPGTKVTDLFNLTQQRSQETEIQAAADKIINRNEKMITEAADRIASTSATNPRGEMFHNLISTSFDEAQLVSEAERQLEQRRQAVKKATRRSSPANL